MLYSVMYRSIIGEYIREIGDLNKLNYMKLLNKY